jgi:hypothetical protein
MINELVLEAKLLQVKLYLESLQEGGYVKPGGKSDFENCQEVTEEALVLLTQQGQQQEGAR